MVEHHTNPNPYTTVAECLIRQGNSTIQQESAPFNCIIFNNTANVLLSHNTSTLQSTLYDILQPYVQYTLEQLESDAVAFSYVSSFQYISLLGINPHLTSIYPIHTQHSDHKPTDSDIWDVISAAIVQHTDVIKQFIQHVPQTNETNRCTTLLLGFLYAMHIFNNNNLHCYEIGSSAGLNTQWQKYCYNIDTVDDHGNTHTVKLGTTDSAVRLGSEWRVPVPQQLANINFVPDNISVQGCEQGTIDLHDKRSVLRLQAYVWPDNIVRFERLKAAIQIAQQCNVHIDQADAAKWCEQNMILHTNKITVLQHTIVWQYLPETTKHRIEQHMIKLGKQATKQSPLIWVCLEKSDQGSNWDFEVTIRYWPNSNNDINQMPAKQLLAKSHPHGTWVDTTPLNQLIQQNKLQQHSSPACITARCKCGCNQYSLLRPPIYSAYCHCSACGELNLNGHNCTHVYINWSEDFSFTGTSQLRAYQPFPAVTQYSCIQCQQHIYSSIPGENWVLTYGKNLYNKSNGAPALLPPSSHIFYRFAKQANLDTTDATVEHNLPIYSDLPSLLSGSGEQMDVCQRVIIPGDKPYKPGSAKLLHTKR